MFVYFNGKIINESKAAISINSRGFRYGDGFFETMKYANGNLVLAELHFDRFFQSLELLQFRAPAYFTREYIAGQVHQLVQQNGHTKLARVRLTIYRGDGALYDNDNMFPYCLIQTWSLQAQVNELNENGLVTGIYHTGFKAADAFSNLKSNNYLLYSQAALYAKQQHWNDAFVLNHRQSLADATIANIFIIKDNTIITPPLTDGPVSGVMRRHLLALLPTLVYRIEERSISAADLSQADEVFLTNAISGIRWVGSVDSDVFFLKHSSRIYKQLVQPLFMHT